MTAHRGPGLVLLPVAPRGARPLRARQADRRGEARAGPARRRQARVEREPARPVAAARSRPRAPRSPSVNRYPTRRRRELRAALSQHLGVPVSHLLAGNGSVEILDLVARALLGPGDNAVDLRARVRPLPPDRGRAQPRRAAGADARVDARPRGDGAGDRRAHAARVRGEPEQPHRHLEPARPRSRRSSARCRRSCLLVLDEAYFEYADEPDYPNGIELVRRGAPVIVTRTFSKVYGLGGLRAGYAVAAPEVLDAVLDDPRGLRHQLGRAGRGRCRARRPRARPPLRRAEPRREGARRRRARAPRLHGAAEPRQLRHLRHPRERPRGVPSAAGARRDRAPARPLRHAQLAARLDRHAGGEHGLPRRARRGRRRDQCMRSNGLVVAIDGPSGAGKSTAGRTLAARLGYTYIDTGAMYRALALKASRAGVSLDSEEALAALCRASSIQLLRRRPPRAARRRRRHRRGALARDQPSLVARLGPPRRARRDGGAPARDGPRRRRRARRPRHRHRGVPRRRREVLPRREPGRARAAAAIASCGRPAATSPSTPSSARCASATTRTRTGPSRRWSARGTRIALDTTRLPPEEVVERMLAAVRAREGRPLDLGGWRSSTARSPRRYLEALRTAAAERRALPSCPGARRTSRPRTARRRCTSCSRAAVASAWATRTSRSRPGCCSPCRREVEHRFHSIDEDLLLLVFFAPAEGTVSQGQ